MRLLVNVDVPDLAAAERFYVAALGLRPGRRFGPFAVELLGLEAPLYLLANEEGSAPAPGVNTRREYGRHWTPVHLDLAVDALEPAVERAVAAGAKLEGGPKEKKWGRIAMLADPFGNGFCLLQFTGLGYDEVAERPRSSRA
ncbi:MAG: VOC family protein [Anaeromyxobacter sp.]